jgi:hypothetical protein
LRWHVWHEFGFNRRENVFTFSHFKLFHKEIFQYLNLNAIFEENAIVNCITKDDIFSDIAPCSLVEVDLRFIDAYFIIALMTEAIATPKRWPTSKLRGAVSQKAIIFILAAVKA